MVGGGADAGRPALVFGERMRRLAIRLGICLVLATAGIAAPGCGGGAAVGGVIGAATGAAIGSTFDDCYDCGGYGYGDYYYATSAPDYDDTW